MQGQFWKIFCGALNGSGAKETHDARHSPRGEPRGRRQARRLPLQGSACRPRRRRPDQSDPRCIRGHEPFRTPSGQFTEPCVARPSWSLHKQTGLLRRFPDFRPHAYFRKTGRQSTCGFTSGEISVDRANFCGVRGRAASAPPAPKAIPPRRGGQGPPL